MMRISVAREVLGVSSDASLSQVSEAYICLKAATLPGQAMKERGIAHGIMKGRSRLHYACSAMPFLFIIFGTIGLGGALATRAYKENRRDSLSQNPFLP